MSDLIVYLPHHGYSEDDVIYVSWLDGNYYVNDPSANSFKISETVDGSNVQYTENVIEGYVREIAETGTSIITGLDHLEGEYVYVISGGNIVDSGTVSGGSLTITSTVFNYSVGKMYAAKLKSMRFEIPNSETVQTKKKRIGSTSVRYIKSKGIMAGQEYNGTEYLTDLDVTYSANSQDVTIPTKGGYSDDGYTVIKSVLPYPMTVLATIIQVEIWEK